jgi:hypothetical protein
MCPQPSNVGRIDSLDFQQAQSYKPIVLSLTMCLNGFNSNDEVLALISPILQSAIEIVGHTSSTSTSPQTEPPPILISMWRLSE